MKDTAPPLSWRNNKATTLTAASRAARFGLLECLNESIIHKSGQRITAVIVIANQVPLRFCLVVAVEAIPAEPVYGLFRASRGNRCAARAYNEKEELPVVGCWTPARRTLDIRLSQTFETQS